MTVRWKFEHLLGAFVLGCFVGLVIGSHFYAMMTG